MSVFGTTEAEVGIRLLHLSTGEDVIGKVTVLRTNNGLGEQVSYRVERPVAPMINGDGQRFQVGLMPYRPFLDAETPVEFRDRDVMFIAEVGKQMENLYVQFTSNITIAGPSDLPRR